MNTLKTLKEDKKKGCGRKFISGKNEYTCGDRWYLHPIKGDVYDILTNYCDDCKKLNEQGSKA